MSRLNTLRWYLWTNERNVQLVRAHILRVESTGGVIVSLGGGSRTVRARDLYADHTEALSAVGRAMAAIEAGSPLPPTERAECDSCREERLRADSLRQAVLAACGVPG